MLTYQVRGEAMKSTRLRINQPENISLIECEIDPTGIKPSECLIETEVSLISAGTELSRAFGLKKGATYPVYPGYCSVGKVLECGSEVCDVKKGDRVLFSAPHGSLHIFDRVKSDGGVLFKLNEKTDPIDGAFLMMCGIAMNGILPADVKLGDTVVIIGMGTLGTVTAILYQQMGVDVIGVEPVQHRAKQARKAGIKQVISCSVDNQAEEIMKLTDNKGADIVVDAAGLSQTIELGIRVAAKHGQVVLLGSPRTDYMCNATPMLNAIHMKMLHVIGAMNRRFSYYESEGTRLSITRNLTYLEKLLNQKIINTDHFISHVLPPNEQEIMEAYRGLMYNKENYTGVVIDWRKEH